MRVSAALLAVAISLGAAGAARSSPTAFSFHKVVSGFDSPVYVTSAPGDATTLYVVEQPGVIAIVRGGKIAGTFLDIRSRIKSGGDGNGNLYAVSLQGTLYRLAA